MKYVSILLVTLMLSLFYGCAPTTVAPDRQAPPPTDDQALKSDQDRAGRGGTGITEEELARAERERLLREKQALERGGAAGTAGEAKEALFKDIRFEYDSYAIKGDDLSRLKDIGKWLESRKNVHLTVEGHCDERGTQEYNLMLGQKRAEVVKDYLVKLGVDDKRIKTVSYGKEAPLDPGHTEEAWAKNRRAHLNVE